MHNYGCQQPGHFRRDCPKAKKGPSHKAETAGEEDKESESEGGSAFPASHTCKMDLKMLHGRFWSIHGQSYDLGQRTVD